MVDGGFQLALAFDAGLHAGDGLPAGFWDWLIAHGAVFGAGGCLALASMAVVLVLGVPDALAAIQAGPVDGRAARALHPAAVLGQGIVAQLLFAIGGQVGPVAHAVRTGSVAASTSTRPDGPMVATQRSL